MRSVTFLLMFAVCLVAWECAATTGDKENSGHNRDPQEAADLVITTKAAEQLQPELQPQPQPQPRPDTQTQTQTQPDNVESLNGPEPQHEDPQVPAHHEDKDGPNKGVKVPALPTDPAPPEIPKQDTAPPTSLQSAQSQPGNRLAGQQQLQQQQQQPQVPQKITSQGSVPKDEITDGDSHNQHNAPPTRTSGDELHTKVVDTQTRTPDAHSGQPEHEEPERRPEAQHSPSSHSTGGVVTNIEDTQPKKGQKTDNAPSGISPPQGPPPTPPTIKRKTPVNGTTTSVTRAAPAEKQHVSPKKPTPNSTPAADNTVHQTNTTTEDKEPNPMQTSLSSTSEPVKGESTPHANTKENLSKDFQSLDIKDSSIGASFACALAALATLVLVSLMPPS